MLLACSCSARALSQPEIRPPPQPLHTAVRASMNSRSFAVGHLYVPLLSITRRRSLLMLRIEQNVFFLSSHQVTTIYHDSLAPNLALTRTYDPSERPVPATAERPTGLLTFNVQRSSRICCTAAPGSFFSDSYRPRFKSLKKTRSKLTRNGIKPPDKPERGAI